MPVAPFKTEVNVNVINHFQGLSNRIVTEWCHAEQDHVEAAYLFGCRKHDVLRWEMGIFAEDVCIPAQPNAAFGQVGASGHRWEQFDVGQHSAGVFPHLKADGGTLWNGDVAIDDGQVGTTFGIGCKLSLQYDLLSFHLAIDNVGNAKLLDGVMQ